MINYLKKAVEMGASDIFVVSGKEILAKIGHNFVKLSSTPLNPDNSREILEDLYKMAGRNFASFLETKDDDFSLSVSGLSRFRISSFFQRNSIAAVIRVVKFGIPDYRKINIDEKVMQIADKRSGLVLVTGAAGSGKSTTLACIVDRINKTRESHIITIEDPIEYLHKNDKSVICQRELYTDTSSYSTALRASLRQSPDVILLGEMRDQETIKTAMTAAETGHLIISTLHTGSAVNTIDRIIDIFPVNQQNQIRIQLADVLKTVVSQQLLEGLDGRALPVFEVMQVTPAIKSLIIDNKNRQIDSVIASSSSEGMMSMDSSLIKLYKEGKISKECVLNASQNKETIIKRL